MICQKKHIEKAISKISYIIVITLIEVDPKGPKTKTQKMGFWFLGHKIVSFKYFQKKQMYSKVIGAIFYVPHFNLTFEIKICHYRVFICLPKKGP